MKLFTKLRNTIKRLPRKTTLAVLTLSLLVGIPLAVSVAEYYPARPAFDYNKPCDANDADIYDRCGSLTGPVFNSFINTPSYGDERAFLDARRTDQTAAGSYKNVLPDVTDGSKEVVLRTYVHNNANPSTNASGLGVAKNTKVRIALPTGTANVMRARSYISADNAALVEDTVDFTGTENFSVEYVPGSAVLYDNDNFASGASLNDSIVTSGATIGSDTINGDFKGCFEFEAIVEVHVRIKPKQNPNISLTKEVRKSGETGWKKEVAAKPGDTVDWLLTSDNTGSAVLNNIVIRDVLPPNVQLVPGSVKWIDASQNAVQSDNPLFDGGINVGNYAPGGGFYMTFSTKVLGNFTPCEIRVRNQAFIKSVQTPTEIKDDADVVITRENCQPPVTPKFSCDSLVKEKISDREYKFKVNYTAINGATFKQFVYNFGDNTPELTTDKNPTDAHTFPEQGTFVTTVKTVFTVNGSQQTVSGDACMTTITTTKPPVTPPVTTTTTVLPNTGIGNLFGMFTAVSLAGAFGHRLFFRLRGLVG